MDQPLEKASNMTATFNRTRHGSDLLRDTFNKVTLGVLIT